MEYILKYSLLNRIRFLVLWSANPFFFVCVWIIIVTQFSHVYGQKMTGSFHSKCMICWLSCMASFSLMWPCEFQALLGMFEESAEFLEGRNEMSEKNSNKTKAILIGSQILLSWVTFSPF